MTRSWVPLVALAALSLATFSAATASETDDGRLLYRVHCSACHGESGQGDGPMKDQLETAVPDLTTIAVEHEGEFPTESVHQIIDGRHETSAHGTREMPVWGFTFQSTGRDSDQEQEVQARVSALTKYLETLQVGTDAHSKADVPKS